jgi:hypothetical protein
MSQGANDFNSFDCVQHLFDLHFTGCTSGSSGATPAENTSRLTELSDSTIIKRADFFTGIYGSFWSKTKITVKSYSSK